MPRTKPSRGAPLDSSHPAGRRMEGGWLFNEGYGTVLADVRRRSVGSLVNFAVGTDPWTSGAFGRAVLLNGTSQFADFPSHPGLELTGDMTLGAIFTPTNAAASVSLCEKGSDSNGNVSYGLGWSSTNSKLAVLQKNNFAATSNYVVTNGTPIVAAAVRTISNTSIRYFVNGVDCGSFSYGASTPVANTMSLGFGSRGNRQGGLYMAGKIEGLFVYPYAWDSKTALAWTRDPFAPWPEHSLASLFAPAGGGPAPQWPAALLAHL